MAELVGWKSEVRPAGRSEWHFEDVSMRADARQDWRQRRNLYSRLNPAVFDRERGCGHERMRSVRGRVWESIPHIPPHPHLINLQHVHLCTYVPCLQSLCALDHSHARIGGSRTLSEKQVNCASSNHTFTYPSFTKGEA